MGEESTPVILVVRFVTGSRVVLVPPLGDGVFEVARHGGRILEDGLGLERRWDDDQLLKLEKQRAYSLLKRGSSPIVMKNCLERKKLLGLGPIGPKSV